MTKIETITEAISEALGDLGIAQRAYDDAKQKASYASLAETDALNKLNQKQKEIDKLFNDLRKAGSGDWLRMYNKDQSDG